MIHRRKDFPREIVVRESVYKVSFVHQVPGEPMDTVGLCCPVRKRLWIRTKQTREERFRTYLHELGHCLEFEYKLKIPHGLIYKLELPIMRLIIDNL